MQQRFSAATGVPFFRVVFAAVTLTVLPGFGVRSETAAASTAGAAAVAVAPSSAANAASAEMASATALTPSAWESDTLGAVDPNVFRMALSAARCAIKNGVVNSPRTLTVIDYSKPSTTNRMWVYDLRNRALMFEELVAHGQGSGEKFATRFGNEPDTHRTSIGLFVTEGTYVGKNGYSLRLNGLDRGFNDRARARAIVMHGAPYVSTDAIRSLGRLGRSWGCPALREAVARKVIDTVKGGSLVFSYYPDQKWLNSSKYLGDCGSAN